MDNPGQLSKKVGVMVVDDSTLCQELICDALHRDPDLEVVATCSNGREAVEAARRFHPQVITMDVEMPVMDGLRAVEAIMAENPTPILVLTSDPTHQAPELTCRALELGALALQVKPVVDRGVDAWNLAREVKLLASVKVIRHLRGSHRQWRPGIGPLMSSREDKEAFSASKLGIVAIGSSTGGPQVIHKLFAELPADFPAPIAIVQHINPSFAESMAAWLDAASRLDIRLAREGDRLQPGLVLVAPPKQHLIIHPEGRVSLLTAPPRDGHIPSASYLLESAGRAYGDRSVGLVLTGMGADGAEGLYALKRAGGRTFIQSKESCVVFGMPGAALATGAVDGIVHGAELSSALVKIARGELP